MLKILQDFIGFSSLFLLIFWGVTYFIYALAMTGYVGSGWILKEVKSLPTLKFKDFIKYYNLNNQEWELKDNCVIRHAGINTLFLNLNTGIGIDINAL